MASLEHPQEAFHDECHPSRRRFAAGDKILGRQHPLRNELVGVLRRQLESHERSHQVAVGPSQLGERCTRRLAMQIAGVPEVNRVIDPWPTGVGIMIHEFAAGALVAENRRLGRERWLIEQKVQPDRIVLGTSDAFDTDTGTVVDWKTIGRPTSEIRAKMERGDLDGYHIQTQVYGLGWERLGFTVNSIALLFVGRAGRLRDAAFIEWPYNPAVAQAAIQRLYDIGARTRELLNQSSDDPWSQVPCNTSGYCGWCPYYDRRAEVATAQGCPGK
jgi:hypothetical protein